MKDFVRTTIYLFILFGINFSLQAAKCSVTLEKLLKEAQMSEKIFPNKSMHQKILKTISTIENSSLEYIKHVDDIEISPKKDLWEYKFRFSDDGPKLTMWLRKDRFFVSSFISLKGKNEFSLVDYIRHISSREEAFRITGMFHKGEISGPKMFELKMEQLEELLSGELGEILRGEKWIDIPDYTMNDYR